MSEPTLIDTPGGINPLPNGSPYEGFFYAFYGSGGFTMDQCFNTIKLTQPNPLLRYDVTKALQVKFDVRTFNAKLGLYKDANNIGITSTTFNPVTDNFSTDEITISADEFVSGLSKDQVISVGSYSTMYSDFKQLVNTYFGYAGGFSSLFSQASEFDINNGVFDASAFINIITPYTIPSGENVKQVTGSITISDINSLLKYAIDRNIFGNRTTQSSTGTSSDISSNYTGNSNTQEQNYYKSNYGMADGFIAGDLIFIPAGTTIKLHLVIDSENFNPLNNIGPSNVSELIGTMDTNRTYTNKFYPDNGSGPTAEPHDMMIDDTNQFDNNGDPIEGAPVVGTKKIFTETTTASTTNIDRILTAPLLILLDNLSTSTDLQPGQQHMSLSDIPIAANASANAAKVSADAATVSASNSVTSAGNAASKATEAAGYAAEANAITSTATGVSDAVAATNSAANYAADASGNAATASDNTITARDNAIAASTLANQNAALAIRYALDSSLNDAITAVDNATTNANSAYTAANLASTQAGIALTNANKAEGYAIAAHAALYAARAYVLAASAIDYAAQTLASSTEINGYKTLANDNGSPFIDELATDALTKSNHAADASTIATNAAASAMSYATAAATAAASGDVIAANNAFNNVLRYYNDALDAENDTSSDAISAAATAGIAQGIVVSNGWNVV
jgi:hypothetical protein